jgi:hypothetical protein
VGEQANGVPFPEEIPSISACARPSGRTTRRADTKVTLSVHIAGNETFRFVVP